MNVLLMSTIVGAVVAAGLFALPVMAANPPEIPAPQATQQCVRYDHLPPVCGYRVFLTPEQFKAIQDFHRQNVDTLKNAK
jgi:hypothetical protein